MPETAGTRPARLTATARERVATALRGGDLAVDATCGNGHDSLFLARAVAPRGRVLGFDIQEAALAATRRRLTAAGLQDSALLLLQGHESLDAALPADWRGRLGAVMFNLGYLPGSDKRIVTGPDTTLAALSGAAANLRPGGILSVLCYRGHAGGGHEFTSVRQWLAGLPRGAFGSEILDSPGPVLCLAWRRVADH